MPFEDFLCIDKTIFSPVNSVFQERVLQTGVRNPRKHIKTADIRPK